MLLHVVATTGYVGFKGNYTRTGTRTDIKSEAERNRRGRIERERGRGTIIKMPASDTEGIRGTRDFTLVVDRAGRYVTAPQVVMQVYHGANNRQHRRAEK